MTAVDNKAYISYNSSPISNAKGAWKWQLYTRNALIPVVD